MRSNVKNRTNAINIMKDGSICKCICYRNYKDCDFEFLDKYHYKVYHKDYGNFLKGTIKNPYGKNVANIGFVGIGEDYKSRPTEYKIWANMLNRCYKSCFRERTDRRDYNYNNCTVSKEWHNFQNFIKWYDNEIRKYNISEPMCIDKDLLIKNNHIYSPDRCLLVPQTINLFLTKSQFARGKYLIGVYFEEESNKYKSQCNNPFTKKKINLGRYNTELEAFLAYKRQKELFAKQLAKYYNGKIDNRIIQSLQKYEVEEDD